MPSTLCLLEQLENAGCRVDVDSFDPAVAKALPFTPHDATSNQALIGLCIMNPDHHDMVSEVAKSMSDADPLDVLTVLHAKFGRIQSENISGRVLMQSSPSFPYDEEKIVEHGKAYAKAMKAEGVSLDRFAIKIPTTSAGMRAGKRLKAEGIQSLGTTLFSLPQAIAASQAGIYAISPYFNPCLAHADESEFYDVADPAMENPAASRIVHMRQTYDRLKKETGKDQPQIKGAGYITSREVMAQLELGCDNVTVLPGTLADLVACSEIPDFASGEWARRWATQLDQKDLKWSQWEPCAKDKEQRLEKLKNTDPLIGAKEGELELASTETDWLEGDVLDKYCESDKATKFRLGDALSVFKLAEDKLKEFVVALQAKA